MKSQLTDFEIFWQLCKDVKINTELIELPNQWNQITISLTPETTNVGFLFFKNKIFTFTPDGKLAGAA